MAGYTLISYRYSHRYYCLFSPGLLLKLGTVIDLRFLQLITQGGSIKFRQQMDSLLYYKRTDHQLLWINSSLHRLLFTGSVPCEECLTREWYSIMQRTQRTCDFLKRYKKLNLYQLKINFHGVYMAYPFCFNGNSSLNIVASFTTALYA